MISNYDRIYKELQIEAQRISEEVDVDPEALARLALEIVDLEDRHRVSRIHAINKKVRDLIETTVVTQGPEGSDDD